MADTLRIKIAKAEPVTRTPAEVKAIKADGDYTDPGWRVLGVPYGGPIKGRDLEGEAFHEDTNIWLTPGQTVWLTYYHGLGPDAPDAMQEIPAVIGKATYSGDDERGHWFDVLLDESEELARRVIAAGPERVRASSGAVSHLVRMGKGGLIDIWPVGELALFDVNEWRIPANDYAVIEAKAKVIPEDAAEAIEAKAVAVEIKSASIESEPIEPLPEEVTMSDEVIETTADTPVVETVSKADFESLKAELEAVKRAAPGKEKGAPVVLKTGIGDSEVKAYAHFLRTGQSNASLKASNATDMNIGTAADGGYAVPTGHYQGIIARRDEGMLANKLGVRRIPGKGLTVNVPLDAEADGEFISTAEAAGGDLDAPALGQAVMTLVKYTKKVMLSNELLEDEDSRLLTFLEDFVGRGMAKTHNSLLITEAGTGGTSLKTFASATTYAAGELEAIPLGADVSGYLDDSGSVAWVTAAPNYAKIAALTGNPRLYAGVDDPLAKSILGFPLHFSNKVAAAGASAKSIYFGNWNFVGLREAPAFEVLRDPFSNAATGQLTLHYYFRAVYKVLQAEAVGYGVHPTG